MWGKEYPKRIISLGAAATEILFEIGAENQIVAVSSDSNFPLMAQKLPKAAGFGDSSISLEKLLSFEPDFVILYAGMHDFLIPMLNRYKIQFYVSNVNSVYNIIEENEIPSVPNEEESLAFFIKKVQLFSILEVYLYIDIKENEINRYFYGITSQIIYYLCCRN